ncbi:MAG: Gfo/Idh/MocA family protein [Phycisphaerales bacterium]
MSLDLHVPGSGMSSGMTRRTFVKTAAVVVPTVAGAAGGMGSITGLAHAMAPSGFFAEGSDTIRLGLIGCGGRGTGAATQALGADGGCVLESMGDVFKERIDSSLKNITDHMREQVGDKVGQRVDVPAERQFVGWDAYQRVIDSGVDVVLITGYPGFRPQHLKAAIAAGKHVFAEKPLAVDAPGIRSVIESAELATSKHLALLVGFCWRYNASMREAFKRVLDGSLGDITSVHTTYLTGTLGKRPRKPEWQELEFQMRNWWHFTWISGDHIVEQAVHSIDRLAWAMNDRLPERVICLGGNAARTGEESGNSFDHFAATYEYAGGLRAFHTCRQQDGLPSDNTDYVYGTKGHAVINGWTAKFPMHGYGVGGGGADGNAPVIWDGKGDPGDAGRMYEDEHKELFASIRAGKPINDGVRAANSCMMAIMARMAAYTGQTITWEQAMNSKESLVPGSLSWDMKLPKPEVAVPGKTKFV